MRVPALIAIVALSGCGADAEPAVVAEQGLIVVVNEGERIRIGIDVAAAPAGGACAPPFSADTFEVVMDSGAELFGALALEAVQGRVELIVEPRCDVVPPGGHDRLVPVTIRARDGCARDYSFTIQVHGSQGQGCAPLVRAWQGDCATMPADASTTLSVASEATPAPICVRVEARDPVHEQLWVRFTGSLPELLVPGQAPRADDFDDTTESFGLRDTTHIRGSFNIDYEVSWEAPPTIAKAAAGTIRVRVGEPGLSMSVFSPASSATELDSTGMGVQLWRLDDENETHSLCMRATRADPLSPPLPRDKPFLRVENLLTSADSSTEDRVNDNWVCGETFRVNVSPPLDAPSIEQITLEMSTCTECESGAPVTTSTPVSRTIPVPVVSVAESMSCGPTDNNTDNMVACGDVVGDDTPEIVFRKRGTNARTCVFQGNAGRHQPVAWAAGQGGDIPVWMGSFGWRDLSGVGVPIIVGQFNSAPRFRYLQIAGGEASWMDAGAWVGSVDSSFDMSAGRSFAANPGMGSTHYAFPFDRDILFRCISPTTPGCADVLVSDAAHAGFVITHVTRADLDGDGTLDVVAFAPFTNPPYYFRVYAFFMSWTAQGNPVLDLGNRKSIDTNVPGAQLRAGAIDRSTCVTSPCPQVVFAADALTESDQAMTVVFNNVTGSLIVGRIDGLSVIRDLASYQNRLIVGMEFGVSEAVPEGSLASWFPRDPVVMEHNLVEPVTNQPLGYGSSVAACVTTRKSVAFTADTATVRWTDLDADVVLP